MKKIKIFVIEDHTIMREMWKSFFKTVPNMEFIGGSARIGEAMECIIEKKPDIVLLDINLNADSGFDAVPLILNTLSQIKIIAVSMHRQTTYVKKMVQLGASGYVTKNSPREEIIKAINAVMENKRYICEEVKNIITDQTLEDSEITTAIKELTVRELEIIRLIIEGLSSKEIADMLHTTLKTVESQRRNILKKLSFKNTASLISFFTRNAIAF